MLVFQPAPYARAHSGMRDAVSVMLDLAPPPGPLQRRAGSGPSHPLPGVRHVQRWQGRRARCGLLQDRSPEALIPLCSLDCVVTRIKAAWGAHGEPGGRQGNVGLHA